MKNFIRIFSCFIIILSVLSCSEKEIITGRFDLRYLFSSYFVPQSINVPSPGTYGFRAYLNSEEKITEENNLTEFLKLSTEYGETGDKIFSVPHPPYPKPYGISSIKFYQSAQGKRADISDKVKIAFRDCSNIILSKYSVKSDEFVIKKVSELTSHDLKWLRERFTIFRETKEPGEFYLVITLENGKELNQQVNF